MSKNTERCSMLSCGKPTKQQDRGWSWVVLFASFVIELFCDGSIAGYGVIFTNMKNDTYFMKHGYTDYEYSLPGAIQSATFVAALGLGGPLVNNFGLQWVACVGGLLAGFSMLAGALFHDINGMVVFYGIFSGMGLGALCLCADVSVLCYFERFRGAAFGIAAAGNGLGYTIIPIILSSLSRYFGTDLGWRRAVCVYSIIVAVLTFLGSLTFKPLEIGLLTDKKNKGTKQVLNASESHLGSGQDTEALEDDHLKILTIRPPGEVAVAAVELFASTPWISGGLHEDRSPNGLAPVHSSYPDISSHFRLHPANFHSKQFLSDVHGVITRWTNRADSLYVSSLQALPTLNRSPLSPDMSVSRQSHLCEKQAICGKDSSMQVEFKGEQTRQNKPGPSCSRFLGWLVTCFDIKIFLNAGFLIICASCVIAQLAYFVPFTYFFLFATRQAGLEENDVLLLITLTGTLHTFGRLVGGMMANIPQVDIIIVMASSCILCAICHFALPFLPHNFTALALYCSGFGFLCAIPIPLQGLLYVRFLGLRRLTMAISNSCLVNSITAAIGPIVAARINDSTGKLDGTFYWCGACFVGSGLMLFLLYLPFVKESEEEHPRPLRRGSCWNH